MAILVILVLAVLWAAVLLPPILRSRNESGAAPGGVADFVARLREGFGGRRDSGPVMNPLHPIMPPVGPVGGPPNGRAPMGPVRVPGGMTPAQRRRRDVLVGMLAVVALTFLMALMSSSMVLWVFHLLADGLLGAYVYLLLQLKARQGDRRSTAHPLAPAATVHEFPMARRPGPVAAQSHVRAPREATVLALRRAGSW